jgi:pimeloyl-ACP methyl ester carboxylesterase
MTTPLTVNGLSFHVIDEGDGPAVLLLHGFPDSSALWRHQVPALVDAGYRVIAPDLRGFGASDRPEGVAAYAMPTLVADVLGIIDTLDVERADVVGHDWGSGLGWTLAAVVPERVRRLVALSVGHPAGYFTRRDPPARAVVVHALLPVRGRGRGGAAARRLGAVPDVAARAG